MIQHPPVKITTEVLCGWHAYLMKDMPSVLAGRLRPDGITFGSNDGLPPEKLHSSLDSMFRKACHDTARFGFDEDPDRPIQHAVFFHAEFLRIHPFQDGNGRIARLLSDAIFLQHNQLPANFGSVSPSEYLAALNHYHSHGHGQLKDPALEPMELVVRKCLLYVNAFLMP